MKRTLFVSFIVLGTAISGFAQDGQQCRLDGAWLGCVPALGVVWTGVLDSETHLTGPAMVRYVGGDASIGGLMPTAKTFALTVGTWHRAGPMKFQYTHITYGLDADGQPVYIAKITGTWESIEDCRAVKNSSIHIAIYELTQDPLGDEIPYHTIDDTSSSVCRRITMDAPPVTRDQGDAFDQ